MFTVAECKRARADEIIKAYVPKKMLTFKITSIIIEEEVDEEKTRVSVKLEEYRGKKKKVRSLSGASVGLAAAFFEMSRQTYGDEFPSILNVTFEEVQIKSKIEKETHESKIEFYIEFRNGRGEFAPFSAEAKSISSAAAKVVLKAFQFYINCELAFLELVSLLENAKKRRRPDIETRLLSDLSKIVEFNSFEVQQ